MAAPAGSALTNPELRTRLGVSGRARYEERFTFARTLDETVAVYADVLADRRGLAGLPAHTVRPPLASRAPTET